MTKIPKKDRRTGLLCITGGTGFLGRHFIKCIEHEPYLKIKALTRYPDKADLGDKTELFAGDLIDYSSLKNFIEPGATVVNLAYLKQHAAEGNLQAAQNLSRLCRVSGSGMLVHVSTADVIGRSNQTVITETTPCNPITAYEKTKYRIEKLFLQDLDKECPVLILRPTAMFGEGGRNLNKHVRDIIDGNRLLNRVKLSVFGRRRMNLVHVENVVSALWFLINRKENINGQCFIVSDDEYNENNYTDLVHMITEELSLPPLRPLSIPHLSLLLPLLLRIRKRSNIIPQRVYSSNKLVRTGFKKPLSFSKGMRLFLRNYPTSPSITDRLAS